jgi:hypothetical protein
LRPDVVADQEDSCIRTTPKVATLAIGTAALLPFLGAGLAQAADGNTTTTLRPVALNDAKAAAPARSSSP